ncbi:Adenylate kinase 2, chloroplastic [Glycine max]|nr:Adenylate kinase 2, chloroplastic [Glycine max]
MVVLGTTSPSISCLPSSTQTDYKARRYCSFPQRPRPRPRPRASRFFCGSPFAPNAIHSPSLSVTNEALNVMISGAPASGKGTQCHLITNKYGLVHIAAGDLLRAEIATGSDNGKRAKQYMEKGQLVPDEIVVMMVKERLLKPDSKENGWLLDGYPRSLSQATALEALGFRPHIFLLLEVSEDVLVERVVGRRLDPVKLRLNTHHQNVESVLSMYKDITVKINGNVSKEEVFAQIDSALTSLIEERKAASGSVAA